MKTKAVAAAALVVFLGLAAAVGGCGGGSSSSSATTGAATTSAGGEAGAQAPGPRPDDEASGDIEDYGKEAGAADRAAVIKAAHTFFTAMADRDFDRMCTVLAASNVRELRAFGGHGTTGCAVALRRLLDRNVAGEARAAAEAPITSVRIEGGTAFVIFKPRGRSPDFFAMKREGGAWKAISVTPGTSLDPNTVGAAKGQRKRSAEIARAAEAKAPKGASPVLRGIYRAYPPPRTETMQPGEVSALGAGRSACEGKTPTQVKEEFYAEAKANLAPGQAAMIGRIDKFEARWETDQTFIAGQLAADTYAATLPEAAAGPGYQGCVYALARGLEQRLAPAG